LAVEEIKKFLKERKQCPERTAGEIDFESWWWEPRKNNWKKLNKEVYYYSQQTAEYKSMLKDPKRLSEKR